MSHQQTARSAGTGPGDRTGNDESSDTWSLGRTVSVGAGGLLLLNGLRRRSTVGAGMAVAGSWLLYSGLRGRSPVPGSTAVGDRIGQVTERPTEGGYRTDVSRSITIDAPAEELHEYWKDPEQLSTILGQFVEITESDEDRLHWEVDVPIEGSPLEGTALERLPIGDTYTWETEFVEDTPGEVLRWQTVEGTRLPSEWTLTFEDAPGDRGTEATLHAEFHPPGGDLGAMAIDRLGFAIEPIVATSLRRFKSLAETGEVPTLVGNPSARGEGDLV